MAFISDPRDETEASIAFNVSESFCAGQGLARTLQELYVRVCIQARDTVYSQDAACNTLASRSWSFGMFAGQRASWYPFSLERGRVCVHTSHAWNRIDAIQAPVP